MKIAIASDHAGYRLKEVLEKDILCLGHEVLDLGTHDEAVPSDYPDAAEAVGGALARGEAERGVVVCGSGVGVCAAVNKFPGVRAGVCHDTYSAHQGVEHDDMNVVCLGQRVVGQEVAREVVRAFLGARFSGEERHLRRLEKLKAIERRFLR
ncbi:MAG: ribose 5-phosphate isomerase B [Planctomycetes bacterium]|nr:ribose 5-phosphate isomerase B [Planctomycetota bacterium]